MPKPVKFGFASKILFLSNHNREEAKGGGGGGSSSRSSSRNSSTGSGGGGTADGGGVGSNNKMGCVNGKEVLTETDLDYISSHTAVSREEVAHHYKNFIQRHPDGKIKKKEFRSMMQTCYPHADSDKLEKHIFRMYDSNSDGYIDFREFMLVLYVLSSGTPEDNLKQIFRIFDINNDGSISQKEMTRIVKDLFHLIGRSDNPNKASDSVLAQKAFQEMDANLDGRVTEEEFVAACLSQEKISSMLALRIVDVFI